MYRPRIELNIGSFCVTLKNAPPTAEYELILKDTLPHGNYVTYHQLKKPVPRGHFEAARVLDHLHYMS